MESVWGQIEKFFIIVLETPFVKPLVLFTGPNALLSKRNGYVLQGPSSLKVSSTGS